MLLDVAQDGLLRRREDFICKEPGFCSVVSMPDYKFGFSRTDVNSMEKELRFVLEWDLRIAEEDLYSEVEYFFAPTRANIVSGCLLPAVRRR